MDDPHQINSMYLREDVKTSACHGLDLVQRLSRERVGSSDSKRRAPK